MYLRTYNFFWLFFSHYLIAWKLHLKSANGACSWFVRIAFKLSIAWISEISLTLTLQFTLFHIRSRCVFLDRKSRTELRDVELRFRVSPTISRRLTRSPQFKNRRRRSDGIDRELIHISFLLHLEVFRLQISEHGLDTYHLMRLIIKPLLLWVLI